MSEAVLSAEARATLAGLADVLIPAYDEMPAASAMGIHHRWIDRVLAARPDFTEPLNAVLAEAAGRDPQAEIERLVKDAPGALEEVLTIVTAAYYMSPKVRRRLGYPGQVAAPPFPDEAEWYLRDGLLDPVIERGPIYRPTDYRPES